MIANQHLFHLTEPVLDLNKGDELALYQCILAIPYLSANLSNITFKVFFVVKLHVAALLLQRGQSIKHCVHRLLVLVHCERALSLVRFNSLRNCVMHHTSTQHEFKPPANPLHFASVSCSSASTRTIDYELQCHSKYLHD